MSRAGQYGSQRGKTRKEGADIDRSSYTTPMIRSSSSTPLGSPKSAAEVESLKPREIRLRPPPTTSQSSSQSKHADSSLLQADQAIQLGLQCKHDLNEDRTLLNLSRNVMTFLDEKSDTSFDDILHSLHGYLTKEASFSFWSLRYATWSFKL